MYQNEIEAILEFILSWKFIKCYIFVMIALYFVSVVVLAIVDNKKEKEIKIFSKKSIFITFMIIIIPPICLRLINALSIININNESIVSVDSLIFVFLVPFLIMILYAYLIKDKYDSK